MATKQNLIFKDAEKAKAAIMKSQQEEIKDLYVNWAKDIGKKADMYAKKTTSSSALQEIQMKTLKKQLTAASKQISNEIYDIIKSNMYLMSDAVVGDSKKWMKSLGFEDEAVNIMFSNIPDSTVRNIVTGQIYESGWSLSKAIWSDNEKNLKDIYAIVGKGVAENSSIYDIAKELETYVNPDKKLPWNFKGKDGVKIFKKSVDYNAQRLARTLVQHGYQQSFMAATKDNPLVEEYVWLSNGSRVCPICKARNGKHYSKDNLPMDHPNGMCTMVPVINNNMIDDLADWFNSPDGTYPEIDEFAKGFGYNPSAKQSNSSSSSIGGYAGNLYTNVIDKFEKIFGVKPEFSSVSNNADDFTDLMSGAYAYVDPKTKSLHINPNVFKDEDTFYKTVGGKIRAYHPNATPESILAHEYGHSVSLGVDEKKIIDNAVAKYVDKYPKSAMDAFIPDYQYAAESIGHYAVTTEHELFAEAFGDVYANGDKAQELSKWIVEEVAENMAENLAYGFSHGSKKGLKFIEDLQNELNKGKSLKLSKAASAKTIQKVEKAVKAKTKKVPKFTNAQEKYLTKYGYSIDNMPKDYDEWFYKLTLDDTVKLSKWGAKENKSVKELFDKYLNVVKYKTEKVDDIIDSITSSKKVQAFSDIQEKYLKPYGFTKDKMPIDFDDWAHKVSYGQASEILESMGTNWSDPHPYQQLMKFYNQHLTDKNFTMKTATTVKKAASATKSNDAKFDSAAWHEKLRRQNLRDMENWCDDWLEKISYAEKGGVETYTGSAYINMNEYLRGQRSSTRYAEEIKQATAALKKASLPEEVIARRGSNYNMLKELGIDISEENKDKLIGTIVTDKGFMSTSPASSGGFDGDIEYVIKVPKGSQAMYVDTISRHKGEKELLINRGGKFIVEDVEFNSYGDVKRIYMTLKNLKGPK